MKQLGDKKRAKMTGRGGTATHFGMPHYVGRSLEYTSETTHYEKAMLQFFGMKYNGHNNGDFSATYPELRTWNWNSKDVIQKTIESLEAKGWLVKTRQGGRHVGCSLYAITWWPVDDCGGNHHHPVERKPSHLWKTKMVPRPTGSESPSHGI